MTDKKTEALKLALEALEFYDQQGIGRIPGDKAITAIREALAQSRSDEEQPAPSGGQQDDLILALYSKIDFLRGKIELLQSGLVQSKRTWRGLTDQEIGALLGPFPKYASEWGYGDFYQFASAIEAKLREKNHG